MADDWLVRTLLPLLSMSRAEMLVEAGKRNVHVCASWAASTMRVALVSELFSSRDYVPQPSCDAASLQASFDALLKRTARLGAEAETRIAEERVALSEALRVAQDSSLAIFSGKDFTTADATIVLDQVRRGHCRPAVALTPNRRKR
jgi:hypothetical protein